jgi:Domain of unknown function (DUF309)
LSYVRLKHTLSAIAIESLTESRPPLTASAIAAYGRRSAAARPAAGAEVDGVPVSADVLAQDVAAGPDAVRRALVATGLFRSDAQGNIVLAPQYTGHAAYLRRQAGRLDTALRLAARSAPADAPAVIRRGAALFNAGLFFECHEFLEDVWRASGPSERAFYHGLVQAAAGCYHAEKGNAHGTAVLLDKAEAKLAPYAPRHFGVDVAGLLASLRVVRDGASRGPYAGPPPVMPLV